MNPTLLTGVVLCMFATHVSAQPVSEMPDLDVQAKTTSLPQTELNLRLSPSAGDGSLSHLLATLPALNLRQQGAHGAEPVIRGLGWERVGTCLNGLPLYGACPSRMDPPVNLFSASSLSGAQVQVGPSSVIHGPVSTAGAVLLEDSLTFPAERSLQRSLSGGIQSDGLGRDTQLEVQAGNPESTVRFQAGASKRGDRLAADGTRVPASREHTEAGLQFAKRVDSALTFELSTRYVEEQNIDYPSLPMDSREAETLLGTAKASWEADGDVLRGIDLRLGASQTDHWMDNRDKPNRKALEASTPSSSDSQSYGLLFRMNGGEGEWRLGTDASLLERDATRTRRMVSTGMTFQDPIWPGPEQEAVGMFAEWEGPLSRTLSFRGGLRMDQWSTDASRADETIVPGPGYGPTTVENAYRDIAGLQGDIAQEDQLFSGSMRFRFQPAASWQLYLGLGHTEAAPNLTQRYQAFGPIPGGYGIGTPDLRPETKQEVELRLEQAGERHRLGFAVHAARIDDFLLPTTLTRLDVNGDGTPDRVRGTVNRDARLWGLEMEGEVQLRDSLRLPVQISWVEGQERGSGDALPEMPPLEARVALAWQSMDAWASSLRLEVRTVLKQDRVSADFGENPTPSFTLLNLRGGIQPMETLRIEAGIENLLNRLYHEHLTREALMPVGDLAAGDEIPESGRWAYIQLRMTW